MSDFVYVTQDNDGHVYARVFADPQAFLAVHADYLDEEPALAPSYRAAAEQAAEQGPNEVIYVTDHLTITKLPVERGPVTSQASGGTL